MLIPNIGPTLSKFAILASAGITNTGPSVIDPQIGVNPGTAITGFLPGKAEIAPAEAAAQAQVELAAAYNELAAMPATENLTGKDLGGLTLKPGVYSFDSSAQLTGELTLDGQGDPEATFVFNIESTLTTASSASVFLIDGVKGH